MVLYKLGAQLNAVSQDQPEKKYQLVLETRIQEIDRVLDFVSSAVPKSIVWPCQTSMVEAFANVVNHAHQALPAATPVILEIWRFCDRVELRVWDHGQPFDWEKRLQQKLANPPGPDDTSGRGIIWIHKLTDRAQYIRMEDERNCLVMHLAIK